MEEKTPVKECDETINVVADAFASYNAGGNVAGSPAEFFVRHDGGRVRVCMIEASMGEMFAAFSARIAKPEQVSANPDARLEFKTAEDFFAHQGEVPLGRSAVQLEELFAHFSAKASEMVASETAPKSKKKSAE